MVRSVVAAAMLLLISAGATTALELLMFRRAGCSWCAAWDLEIAPIYPKTDIGKRVPIRFVDIDRIGDLEIEVTSPVRFSPTFVLVDDSREIARIEGYPGQDFFWGRLKALVPPLPQPAAATADAPSTR